jgi:hypothetical protein
MNNLYKMEKLNLYSLDSSQDRQIRVTIDSDGNTGIGITNPSKKLEVVGDISFNGSLYQNGALFIGGSTIDETTDVSLNNLKVHGDLSANDASFNAVEINDSLNVTGDYQQNGANINTIYATIASPTLTGTPAAPTANSGTNTTQLATTAFVSTAVSNLVNGAPGALDTLSELASALGNSDNFATNVTNTLGSLQTQIDTKQATLTFNAPSSNNGNPSTSAQIKTALDTKQSTIDQTTDVSLKDLNVHGDLSANDASFNNITVLGDISFNGNLYQNGSLFTSSGGGGLTDLSATSIADLSDVSFNSASTTQGSGLIWNNTDKIWEPGTLTASITNTTTTTTTSNNSGWVDKAPVTNPAYRVFSQSASNGNDKMYFVGGKPASTSTNHVWEYTLSTNSWTRLYPTGVSLPNVIQHALVFYNNALYLFGGWPGSGSNTNTLHKLDLSPTTPVWSLITTNNAIPNRRDPRGVMWGSKLLIFAGYIDINPDGPRIDLWQIDLAAQSPAWTLLDDGSTLTISSQYSVCLGVYQNKLSMVAKEKYCEYDLNHSGGGSGWSEPATTNTPSTRFERLFTMIGDKLYLYGGRNGTSNYYNNFYVLDVTTKVFTEITSSISMPFLTHCGLSAMDNDTKLIICGRPHNVATGYTYEYTIPITTTTTTYNPVEINKLSTYYALSVGPNYDTASLDNSGSLIVEGNVGIGVADPSDCRLEVAGDISFNGNLYQNGSLFTGGTTIDETTDVSLNDLTIYGDISGSNDMVLNGRITIAKEERDQTPINATEYQILFNSASSYDNWISYNQPTDINVPLNMDWTLEYSHKITFTNQVYIHFAVILGAVPPASFANNTYFMYFATLSSGNAWTFRYNPKISNFQTSGFTFSVNSFSEFVDVKWMYTHSDKSMKLYFNGNIVASISSLKEPSHISGRWGFGEWSASTHHLINPRITYGGNTYVPNNALYSTSSTAPTVTTSTVNTAVLYAMDVNGKAIFSDSVTANGSVLSSDDRIKHNEQPITNALSTISKITPKRYFKTKNTLYDARHNFLLNEQNQPLSTSGTRLLLNKDYTIETGIIAQEIQSIPELEFTVQNTTPLGVDYNSIHCTHIAATKELHQIVQTQQTHMEEQQQEIEHLKLINQDMNAQLNQTLGELQTIKAHLGI